MDDALNRWFALQSILERGEWIARGRVYRLLWLDEAGKPWAAVVKRTGNDEAYLQSYRRARARQVAAWTAQKETPGGIGANRTSRYLAVPEGAGGTRQQELLPLYTVRAAARYFGR